MTVSIDPPGASAPRAFASALAVAAGCLAALNTFAACLESAAVRELAATRWVGAVVLFLLATLRDVRSGATRDFARIGLRLAAASIVAFGTVETPSWVSIDTFGISVAASWLALGALAAFYFLERNLGNASAGALALIVFSAFGGPFFIRDGDDFHAMHALLAIAAVASSPILAAPSGIRLGTIALLLLALLALPLALAVDRDRHLEAFFRACAALAPLPLCAAVAAERERASRAFASAWLALSALGVAAAVAAVIEGGMRFELAHAWRVRLPLFGEHPNIVAPFFAVAAPLLIALASSWRRWSLGIGVAAIVTAGGCVVALGATRSRAAAGGLALAVALWVALALLRRTRGWFDSRARIGTAAFAAIAICGVVGYLGFDFLAAKLTDSSMAFRAYMWETAASAIADRPWLGHGLLASEPLMNHAVEGDLDGRSKDTHPHMLLLAIAMGAGIPAAIAYGALCLALILLASRRAVQDDDPSRATVGAAIAASTLALFASNLLDQGLALHTPIPLHLGLLLFAYSFAFPSLAHGAAPVASPLPRPRAIALRAALWLGFAVVASDVLGARCIGASREAARRRDPELALALTRAAVAVDPLDSRTRFAHADALDRAGERAEAVTALARLTELLPFSPYPWERLANLEYDRRQFPSALLALERAHRLDPTGPSAAQWTLRQGNILANLGERDAAMEKIALAVRYDFGAAQRAGWLQDGQREYFIPVAGGESPIYLTGVLMRNRELLPDLVARDPIKARRLATTLVKIEMSFRRYRAAKETIDLYFSLTDVPWLPLEHLAAEIARLQATDTRPDATPGADAESEGANAIEDSPPTEVSDTELAHGDDASIATAVNAKDDVDEAFEAVAGRSILYVDLAHAKLLAGDPEGARAELARGLAATYDMVAEREAIAVLLDGEIECAMAIQDPAAAKLATKRALYFRPRPADRARLVVDLGEFLLDRGDTAGALAALSEALVYLSRIAPERAGKEFEAAGRFAHALASHPDTAAATKDRLDAAAADSGCRLVIATLAYTGTAEGNAAHQRLKRDFPEWLPALRAPR